MTLPETVIITPEELASLTKLDTQRESVAAFVQQVVTAGERRNTELLEQGKAVWEGLAVKYKLDLQHVAYGVEDGKLVPKQVRL